MTFPVRKEYLIKSGGSKVVGTYLRNDRDVVMVNYGFCSSLTSPAGTRRDAKDRKRDIFSIYCR